MDEEDLSELEELRKYRNDLLSDIQTLQVTLNEVNEKIIQLLLKE